MATLSILGLYNYDDTIFDGMILPSEIDKTTLVDNILLECAELEVIYPSANLMKRAIGSWSLKRYRAWSKLQTVLYEDYDPFINIKRDEERIITQTRDLANTSDETRNLANSLTTTLNENQATSTNAYDSGTGTPREAVATTGTDSNQGTDTGTRSIEGTDTGTVTTHETFHVEGDSAITDAQDVAMKESKLRLEYDLYHIIIEEFKSRFCILVY